MPAETARDKLELVMGREGVERLRRARVMVLGAGGVGSNCIEALARGGVGHLVIVDGDEVQQSNINRQAIAFTSTVGRRKVEVMKAMIADIDPETHVDALDRFVRQGDVEALMREVGNIDYIVDAIDTVSTKLAIAELAEHEHIPLLSSMGAANKLRPECLEITDISRTSMCPLCRVMRKEARKRGIRHLRVIYSHEEPVRATDKPARSAQGADKPAETAATLAPESPTPATATSTCVCSAPETAQTRRTNAPLGTASYMPPIMGQMAAGYVIRELAGIGHGSGKRS